jgi:hypothetical protein
MNHFADEKIVYFAKLFILIVGAALLLIGFFGIAYDYATDLIIEAGNAGWMLMTAGILLMLVAIAGFVIIPTIRESHRIRQLNEYYRSKYPENSDLNILVHDIREQLQIMEGRCELLDELSTKAKSEYIEIKNIDAVKEEFEKQKASYEKITLLISLLREYAVKRT